MESDSAYLIGREKMSLTSNVLQLNMTTLILVGSQSLRNVLFSEAKQNSTDSVVDMSIGQTSAASVYSFSSSQDGLDMLRETQGRMFNQSDLYHLPAGKYLFCPST